METNNIEDMVEELNDAVSLMSNEQSEWWSGLAVLWRRARDFGSREFVAALRQEIEEEHLFLKQSFRVEEVVVNETRTVRKMRRLDD